MRFCLFLLSVALLTPVQLCPQSHNPVSSDISIDRTGVNVRAHECRNIGKRKYKELSTVVPERIVRGW